MPDEIKPTEVPNAAQTPPLPLPHGGILAPQGGGGILAGAAPRIPIRGAAFDAGATVTSDLTRDAGAFGNVLTSIGSAVAVSQRALDASVIDTIKALNDKKIEVVTTVVQELTEDGIPDPDPNKTQFLTKELSVLNFFTPEFHEFKEVSIAMDLSVSDFHSEQGVQFHNHQETDSFSGSYTWGFGGWFNYSGTSGDQAGARDTRQDVSWNSGQVLMDARLAPRRTSKFPVPARIDIGPQIYVSQGPVTDVKSGDTVTGRSMSITVQVRKTYGDVVTSGQIVVDAGSLLVSGSTDIPTDAASDGKVKLTLTRNFAGGANSFQKFPVDLSFGMVHKTFNLTL